jgi:hypothetical protein
MVSRHQSDPEKEKKNLSEVLLKKKVNIRLDCGKLSCLLFFALL